MISAAVFVFVETLMYTCALLRQAGTQITFHNCHAGQECWDGWSSLWQTAANPFPWASVAEFPLSWPVSCLSPWQPVSNNGQAGKKNHEAMWIHNGSKRKEKVRICRRGTLINSISIRRKNNLFCFDKFDSLQLQPATRKPRPWRVQANELISIMHLRIARKSPAGPLIILGGSSRGCQRGLSRL